MDRASAILLFDIPNSSATQEPLALLYVGLGYSLKCND